MVKVPNLEPDNTYSFRVAAKNNDGQSEFSDESATVQLKCEEHDVLRHHKVFCSHQTTSNHARAL